VHFVHFWQLTTRGESVGAVATPGHRGEQIQWSGRTWYRKKFNVPPAWHGKKNHRIQSCTAGCRGLPQWKITRPAKGGFATFALISWA